MSTKPFNEQTFYERHLDFDWNVVSRLVFLALLLSLGFCDAALAQGDKTPPKPPITEPDSTITEPQTRAVPIGQTFGKQIQDLLQQQSVINQQLTFVLSGIRDQAGLDTTYQFRGFQKGKAVFVKPPKKE